MANAQVHTVSSGRPGGIDGPLREATFQRQGVLGYDLMAMRKLLARGLSTARTRTIDKAHGSLREIFVGKYQIPERTISAERLFFWRWIS